MTNPLNFGKILSKSEGKNERFEQNDVNYVENMSKDLVHSLREILKYYENNNDRYNSPERARFKRLRVELGKKLMEIQKAIY